MMGKIIYDEEFKSNNLIKKICYVFLNKVNQFIYSVFNAFTGFSVADLNALTPSVKEVIKNAIKKAITNIHHFISIL